MTRPRALVTGAGIRLGRAIALELGQRGLDIVVHYRSSAGPAEAVADALRDIGVEPTLCAADLAQPSECAALIQSVLESGPLDVLVNSAAAWAESPVSEISVEAWDAMQAVNTRAPFLLSQGLGPRLSASQRPGGGAIINIADIAAEHPSPGYVHYGVSKAGLLMLTRALALELAPEIRVNAVSPGTVLPPEDMSAAELEAIRQSIPSKRFGEPSDIASAVAFLALDAPYITGQILSVDGGRSIGGALEAGP